MHILFIDPTRCTGCGGTGLIIGIGSAPTDLCCGCGGQGWHQPAPWPRRPWDTSPRVPPEIPPVGPLAEGQATWWGVALMPAPCTCAAHPLGTCPVHRTPHPSLPAAYAHLERRRRDAPDDAGLREYAGEVWAGMSRPERQEACDLGMWSRDLGRRPALPTMLPCASPALCPLTPAVPDEAPPLLLE